jgi:hypothetical protein
MVTDHGTDARVTLDDGTVIGERDKAVRAKPNQPDRLRRLQQALEAVLAEAGCRGEILDRDRPAGNGVDQAALQCGKQNLASHETGDDGEQLLFPAAGEAARQRHALDKPAEGGTCDLAGAPGLQP